MVVLESLKLGKPVIVNGQCSVLRTHCIRSNAGLYYENYYEFKEILEFIKSNDHVFDSMSFKAKKYIEINYNWNKIINKFKKLL